MIIEDTIIPNFTKSRSKKTRLLRKLRIKSRNNFSGIRPCQVVYTKQLGDEVDLILIVMGIKRKTRSILAININKLDINKRKIIIDFIVRHKYIKPSLRYRFKSMVYSVEHKTKFAFLEDHEFYESLTNMV